MDMGTDMSGMKEMGGTTMSGMMKPWLHFSKGDALIFAGWVPVSTGSVIGACIGLFLLAIIERINEVVLARLANLQDDNSIDSEQKRLNRDSTQSEVECLPTTHPKSRAPIRITDLRITTPFIPAHDFARGALQVCQAALAYALMLAVMTFNAGYIIAIVLGLGVGETLFGRFGANAHHH